MNEMRVVCRQRDVPQEPMNSTTSSAYSLEPSSDARNVCALLRINCLGAFRELANISLIE